MSAGTTALPAGRPEHAWFTHDRFGMFVHWGLYALPPGTSG